MTEPPAENGPQSVRRLHALYCQWTGQNLSLRFDRERLWYEFLRAGFTPADLKCVVAYLQKQIRAERRNVGALKLSNLLQLDRFEEDLNISRVRLKPPLSSQSRRRPRRGHLWRSMTSRGPDSSINSSAFVNNCAGDYLPIDPRLQHSRPDSVSTHSPA